MPIYEYACPDCEHQFENIQKFSDPLLTECPKCGVDKLKKLVSATSFHLKGSGWYKDHYGLKSNADTSESKSSDTSSASDSSSTPAAAPSEGGGGATTDSSPASTTGGTESNGGASS